MVAAAEEKRETLRRPWGRVRRSGSGFDERVAPKVVPPVRPSMGQKAAITLGFCESTRGFKLAHRAGLNENMSTDRWIIDHRILGAQRLQDKLPNTKPRKKSTNLKKKSSSKSNHSIHKPTTDKQNPPAHYWQGTTSIADVTASSCSSESSV